jgi:hypothetical protein
LSRIVQASQEVRIPDSARWMQLSAPAAKLFWQHRGNSIAGIPIALPPRTAPVEMDSPEKWNRVLMTTAGKRASFC